MIDIVLNGLQSLFAIKSFVTDAFGVDVAVVFQNDLDSVNIVLLIIDDQNLTFFLIEKSNVDFVVVARLNLVGCILIFDRATVRFLLQFLIRIQRKGLYIVA